MKGKNTRGIIILLLTAIIWGFAFVAQSSGGSYLKPFTFNGLRSILASFALLIYIFISSKIKKVDNKPTNNKTLFMSGILSGLSLFVATSFQQMGIQYTTAGKAGFITSLYIIIVPIISLIFHKKVGLNIWISVVIALVGFYFLCMIDSFTIDKGDVFILICALFFSIQIIIIDKYANNVDGVKMSCLQFFTVFVLSIVPMIFEKPTFEGIKQALPEILYLGLVSSGVGYTLQIIGQKDVNPTAASLILSLESVFSLLFGMLILRQIPNTMELIGCGLIFCGVILSQINFKGRKEK